MKPKMIIVLILVVLVLLFIIQNTGMVHIQLYFWKISMSGIIMISFLLLIGFVVGYLLGKAQKI